jgi:hypothetical protein
MYLRLEVPTETIEIQDTYVKKLTKQGITVGVDGSAVVLPMMDESQVCDGVSIAHATTLRELQLFAEWAYNAVPVVEVYTGLPRDGGFFSSQLVERDDLLALIEASDDVPILLEAFRALGKQNQEIADLRKENALLKC